MKGLDIFQKCTLGLQIAIGTCSFTVYLGFGHLIPLSIFAILILVHAYLAVIPFKPATSVASPGVINGF